jgi:hypothetical protein
MRGKISPSLLEMKSWFFSPPLANLLAWLFDSYAYNKELDRCILVEYRVFTVLHWLQCPFIADGSL